MLSIVAVTGCAATVTDGPNYYLLSATTEVGQPFDIDIDRVGLGPVSLPSHFDREGILTYNDNNQLVYAESHRWAEPLQENVLQVLRTNIVHLLPKQRIVFFPWRQQDKPKYQITINVSRFRFTTSPTGRTARDLGIYDETAPRYSLKMPILRSRLAIRNTAPSLRHKVYCCQNYLSTSHGKSRI